MGRVAVRVRLRLGLGFLVGWGYVVRFKVGVTMVRFRLGRGLVGLRVGVEVGVRLWEGWDWGEGLGEAEDHG